MGGDDSKLLNNVGDLRRSGVNRTYSNVSIAQELSATFGKRRVFLSALQITKYPLYLHYY